MGGLYLQGQQEHRSVALCWWEAACLPQVPPGPLQGHRLGFALPLAASRGLGSRGQLQGWPVPFGPLLLFAVPAVPSQALTRSAAGRPAGAARSQGQRS